MANPDRDGKIFVGKGEGDEFLSLALANRHGLATGATGTGKTVSLQVLAEGFSRAGVPVFAADVKGDLSGIAARGEAKPELIERAEDMGGLQRPQLVLKSLPVGLLFTIELRANPPLRIAAVLAHLGVTGVGVRRRASEGNPPDDGQPARPADAASSGVLLCASRPMLRDPRNTPRSDGERGKRT